VGKLNVSTFLTLDGVMQAPGDASEFDRGGWQLPFFDVDAGAIAKGWARARDAAEGGAGGRRRGRIA
jgi:hypothetical protein